jgi:tetratricopeptide (TPR) repeat protein
MSSSSIAKSLLVAFLVVFGVQCLSAQEPATTEQAAENATPVEAAGGNAGQSDLDSAVIQRIDAQTPDQLEAVSALLESAIKKGLDEENRSFAKKMLGSVLLQRSELLVRAMASPAVAGRRRIQFRDDALRSLEKAAENDPTLVEAYLLIAELNLKLPGGDPVAVVEATTKAIELLEDDPVKQSLAYLQRALAQTDEDARMADLDAAAEKNPDNLLVYQARAGLRMKNGDVEGAVADLEHILSQDPTNSQVAQEAVQQLVDLGRVEDALRLLTKSLEAKPSEGLYRLRAILYRMEGKETEALADLNKALALQPKDPVSLLQRAEIALFQNDIKSAKRDLKAASDIDPRVEQLDQAIFVRCLVAVEEGRMADAINDMKLLVSRDSSNVGRQLQLANLYQQDERPRKAIDVFSAILDRDPNNAAVLRSRGDALLSVGDHTSAIDDYKRAIKMVGALDDEQRKASVDLSGILNNLAWVLSTSPNESIRDGERAVELGLEAAELTEFKEAHILSTLAASYAENGDFEKAIEWSSKAVERAKEQIAEGKDPKQVQLEQLEKELESYRKGEAWREKQETEENEIPILSPDDLIDT